MTKDPAWALAEHVCGAGFDALPETTRVATRHEMLDTFGCLLGGSGRRASTVWRVCSADGAGGRKAR